MPQQRFLFSTVTIEKPKHALPHNWFRGMFCDFLTWCDNPLHKCVVMFHVHPVKLGIIGTKGRGFWSVKPVYNRYPVVKCNGCFERPLSGPIIKVTSGVDNGINISWHFCTFRKEPKTVVTFGVSHRPTGQINTDSVVIQVISRCQIKDAYDFAGSDYQVLSPHRMVRGIW